MVVLYLSLVDTKVKTSSVDIKSQIMDVLSSFGIAKSNVLACITDNSANIVRAVNLLNEDGSDSVGLEGLKELADVDDVVPRIDDTICHMRCTEHTLQPGIRNGLKR